MMETKEKLQRVLDVIDGRAHPSTLVEILPKPGVDEENVIRLAVDYLIARERERTGGHTTSRFRLRITRTKEIHEGDEVRKEEEVVHETDWLPEHSQISVPMMTAQVRQNYPNAEISVVRSYEN